MNNSLISDLMPYLEPAAQNLIRRILRGEVSVDSQAGISASADTCLLYTSDAADE